ncbi:cytochrome P450 [Actinophytocola algeriensis]|uniref:Fatty-acid peroxygenase n=1 Tax=Actinophytocola algeriensis TaxID=1768010 RepID=A0A7W7VIE8_9PSEU|nr:cytochrome P450 [Actinophytocola algeriensis]MBB4911487.1 fatty-acid peroxygenase [Actinophytocola algeriensis]MBE1473525.1 fatty-acid peroxygenase [Actinophytocola algeriensis]
MFDDVKAGHTVRMRGPRGVVDSSLSVLLEGYAWLPARRARSASGVAHTRVLGQRAVGLCGPDAARFFYDQDHVRRHTAIPWPVQNTLFGRHAVHTLDGEAHRCRKDVFLKTVTPAAEEVAGHAAAAWDDAVSSWRPGEPVVLFDEAARIITRGMCRWAGVPLPDADVPRVAADLVAMVDGFATPGPRHWRARAARGRREAWLGQLVTSVRAGAIVPTSGTALDAVSRHREIDGPELTPRLAAVELLNIIRPAVATCWFVAYAGHALHTWPQHRQRLRSGDPAYAEAFAHELRRFYPFAPFIGGRAVRDLDWRGERIPKHAMVLLDLWGHNHDEDLWGDPYTFRPERFLGRDIGPFELVPQGAGDPYTNHRCPGEPAVVAMLRTLAVRLARLDYEVPDQDLAIALRRIPARPASGFVLTT